MRANLRQPRAMLALTAAIAAFGVFSSSVGIGALPTSTLPVYGVTDGDGSRTTVAELGDVNGDGIQRLRRRHALRRPPTGPTRASSTSSSGTPGSARSPRAARTRGGLVPDHRPRAARCSASRSAGGDVNGDGLRDIAIGAPMAGPPPRAAAAPSTSSSARPPGRRSTRRRSRRAPTPTTRRTPRRTRRSAAATTGSCRTGTLGMSLAVVARRQRRRLRRPRGRIRPTPTCTAPAAAASPCSTASARACTSRSPTSGRPATPTSSTSTIPTLDDQHVGESVAAVRGRDGRRRARHRDRRAAGRSRRAHRRGLGLDHQRPPAADRRRLRGHKVDASCPWIRINELTTAQGYRIDGARPATGSARRSPASATRTATASPTSRSASRPPRPTGARTRARSSWWPGSAGSATRDLALPAAAAHLTARRPAPASARRVAAAGDIDGDGRVDLLAGAPGEASFAGAAYFVRGAPGTTSTSPSPPRRSRSPARARRPAAPSPPALRSTAPASTADRRAGAGDAFVVSGPACSTRRSRRPVLGRPRAGPAPASTPSRRRSPPRRQRRWRRRPPKRQAEALPAQAAEGDVPPRQGQAREGEARAVPRAAPRRKHRVRATARGGRATPPK